MSEYWNTKRQERLDKYISSVMDLPQFVELRERAYKDIALWGQVTPETNAMKNRIVAQFTKAAE